MSRESDQEKRLPEWATLTCDECGLPLWDGHVWKYREDAA